MALGSSSVGVPVSQGRAWGAPVPLAGDRTAQAPLAAEGQKKRLLARESSDLLSEQTNCA